MIRAYRETDLEALLGLFHRSVHTLGRDHYGAKQLAAWAPDEPDRVAWRARLATGTTFVDERDGTIAGFARFEDSGYLDLFYVDPTWTGQGIGSGLLTHALERLRAAGCARAWCHASLIAVPFFERHGFHAVARRSVRRNGVELDRCSMARDLQGSTPGTRRAGS